MDEQRIAEELVKVSKELQGADELKYRQEPFAVYENDSPDTGHIYLKFDITGPYDKSQAGNAPVGTMRYSIGVDGKYKSADLNLNWKYVYSLNAKTVERPAAFSKSIQKELEKRILWKTGQEYKDDQWTGPNGRLKAGRSGKNFASVIGRTVKSHVAREKEASRYLVYFENGDDRTWQGDENIQVRSKGRGNRWNRRVEELEVGDSVRIKDGVVWDDVKVKRIKKAAINKEAMMLWEKVVAEYGRKMAHRFHTQLLHQAGKYTDDKRLNPDEELWAPDFMPIMMEAAIKEMRKMKRSMY